jgi:class 3 adenylate cyclase
MALISTGHRTALWLAYQDSTNLMMQTAPEEVTERRLAAILAADAVGFGRLMQADEAGRLAALKARRPEILSRWYATGAVQVLDGACRSTEGSAVRK